MARFVKKQKKEIGVSPDELLFRGRQKSDEIILRIIDYDANNLEEKGIHKVQEALRFQEKNSVTWLNVDGLHDAGVMKEISKGFDLDSLILAEVMNTGTRPKIVEYHNCIYISIKMLQQNDETNKISVENLSLIITKSVLFSFQERRGDVFEPVRARIRKQKKRIRSSGTDYLAFALLDVVIDNYIYVISVLGEKIESLEEDLAIEPKQSLINEINNFKRELNFLRKNIKPAKEMILALSKMESDLINESSYIHFKELLDNIDHASDSSDSYREILSDQLNIYHTTISSKLNDIMKFLTIFSVVFIPITFIAGIYGTNFDYVPELHFKYSYFIMWGVILLVALGMLTYFRRRKWF
ncbi:MULTISPECIES: magnesium/cobalt transporter CorA [unclassified Lentimicrobium]|uniref:magnesium/cobalt transporter CorA n=1 Tax=unclassified Lentimicrobium TaxID=2677434 RepID=UPI0015537199|nr:MULTISPECIES: magnesium/cobalt transporter CorA [unclassified Lentimicrobium]NPD45145.1 magnesium/cobalt transporter CorA [Lentimicrobium sp. S6]NPD86559.1 magnesium/cobalt transporter CorA [Lentimicrobium sp. L6]